jgi:hypothetical protein
VPEVTRRGLLAATAAALPLLAGGCKGVGALGTPPSPLPDVAVAQDAIAREMAMIARYQAVLAAVPSLAGQLGPLLAQHRDHLGRLRPRLVEPAGRPTPAARAAAPRRGTVPATAGAAVAYLAAEESAASLALLRHLQLASPSFAQLLASIAACEAAHAFVLGPGRPA